MIYTATSWWNVVGVVAYLPWILHFALRTVRGEGGRGTFAALVVARALLLYLGQVQLFIYAVCFELLCVLLAAPAADGGDRRLMPRRLGRYAIGLYVSAALALPLVEPLWEHAARSQDRAATLERGAFAEGGYDVVAWLRGAVDPYPDDPLPGTPVEYSLDRLFFFLSFTGHATLLLLAWLALRRTHALCVPARAFVVPLVVAFLWATGSLDRVLYLLPVLNRFRWPFRVNLFVVFFLVVLAAAALPAVVAACSRRWGVRAAHAVAALVLVAQVGGLAEFYLRHPQRSYNFLPHRERPPLVEPLAAQLASGRIVSLGFHDHDPYGSAQVAYDYASRWGLFQYSGYANLLSARQLRHVPGLRNAELHRPSHDGVFRPREVPFADFRDWGIAWYVVGRNHSTPEETTYFRQLLTAQGMRAVAEDARRIVFHDPRALSLATVVGNPAPVALHTGGSSLEARLPPSDRPRQLRLCFLRLPGMTARAADGRPLRFLADPLERIVVDVPAGVRRVRVVYREPALARGLRDAALLLALPLVLWLPMQLRRRKAPR